MKVNITLNYTADVPKGLEQMTRDNLDTHKRHFEENVGKTDLTDFFEGAENVTGTTKITILADEEPAKPTYIAELPLEYLDGHLRYGHWEAELTAAEKVEFDSIADPEEKAEFIKDRGDIIVDDYEINDWAQDTDGITVTEVN